MAGEGLMEPRAPQITEYDGVLKFLNENLRPNSGWSISTEYPTALTKENINNIRIIKDGDRVLSHAVVKPLVLKTPMAIFKVAAIGSVVTETAYRNQGLSKTIINECLSLARAYDCDFAVLWTNLYDFYRALGFELVGNEINMTIEKPLVVPAHNLKFIKGTNVDPSALLKLMNQHSVISHRTVEDIRRYLQIPNSRVYTAWSPQGTLEAYAVEGKGADLDGYIHEWGGGVSKLIPLLDFIHKDQKRNLNVIAPIHASNFIHSLTQSGASYFEGHLGMIKILNYNNLFNKIIKHTKTDLGMSDFVMQQKKEDTFEIGTKKDTLTTSNPLDLTKIIFGPKDVREVLKFQNETADILNRVYPLRLWFWGWDSI